MSQRTLGLLVAGLGIVITLVGVVGLLGSIGTTETGSTDAVEGSTSTTAGAPSTTLAVDSSTTSPSTTAPATAATSSTSTPTSTSTSTTSTTAPAPIGSELVKRFVVEFAEALASGNREFIRNTLHPAVAEGFGEDLCTGWIEAEIMTLSNYQLTNEPEGPVDQVVATPSGNRTITDSYSAEVSFMFQGAEFTGGAGFGLVDGKVFWLGQCR